jgi:hypothetical protein
MWFILTASILLLLSACATTQNAFPKITIYGAGIAIDRVSDHWLDTGELQVVVYGHSLVSYRRALRYRAQWIDDAGRPIETVLSTWNPMQLDGGRPFDLSFVGPGSRARDYRIEIEVMEKQ